ncbi:hypothetical protein BX666DRAFT_2110756 [Dichotomocladium elegans]|nr:hypothetical protein BX666DRAFT_2110756 [Dichotomocladium elegans]
MKFTGIAAISSLLVAIASAQASAGAIVSITSPLTGTTYKAGSKAIISWINPQVQTISVITLAKGPSTALQPVAQIAQNVNAASGRFEWDVPYDCENGNDYAFELGQSPELAFAGPFSIEGCTGGGFSSASNGSTSAAPSTPSTGSTPAAPPSSGSSSNSPSASPVASKPASGANASASQPANSSQSAANQAIPGLAAVVLGGAAAVYQLF